MADKRIKGITIEIDGETKKLNEALKDVNKQIATSNAELKDLRSALKLDPKNTELLAQKQEVLSKEIKSSSDRLNTLKETQKQMGDYNSLTEEQKENYRALSAEISRTESSLKSLNNEFRESSRFSLDKLNDSLSGIREKSTQLVKDMAKVGLAIGGVLTTLGVASIKSYAEYEQLVGGVETLFKTSSKEVQEYAKIAYKTAGLSANEYLETVTSFSASLIQSLNGDTAKSAKIADMAIKDMSDNANKMGTDMSMIQNAYQGFAKQNYTMLDNLKLGYGGTKTEMERLIKDANKVKEANGQMADLSIERFSDMVEAIHIIQNEMGITGTTAEEADKTILGSVNSMKASWKNLLNAVADDNADMSKAVDDFVDSAITAGKNIVPRIKTIIEGIKKLFNSLVREVFPKLKREIPELAPIINIFEWFIEHKNLVITAVKAIIGAFAVTKIVDFATKIKGTFDTIAKFATGGIVGSLTTAIGGLIAVGTTLASVFSMESEEERKARLELEAHTDSVRNHAESWNELQEAQTEAYNKSMNELSYYEGLYLELQSIVDENGKVQKGYEKRAEFITGELSKAYGIEIDIVNGEIQGYKDLQNEIDKLIEKKRAEAMINSQTAQYEEALANKEKAYDDMLALEADYDKKKKEYEETRAKNENSVETIRTKFRYEEAKRNYKASENQYNEYIKTIAIYENNYENMQSGHYDKIESLYERNIEFITATDNEELSKKKAYLKELEDDLNRYTELYQQTGNDAYLKKKETTEKLIEQQKKEINDLTETLKESKSKLKQAMENSMDGLLKGVDSKYSQVLQKMRNLANDMVSTIKGSLKIASPSKEMIQVADYIMQGLMVGISKDENALLNQVDSLGNSIIGNLYASTQTAMSGLGGKIKTSINPTINPSVAYDLNYKLMANAMKEALQEVDVELDDRQVGRFIDKTISEEVFN